jgi:hypothetical protein
MSAPTARDLVDGVADMYPGEGLLPALPQILAARVEAVLARHRATGEPSAVNQDICAECSWAWPCPTVRALDGKP